MSERRQLWETLAAFLAQLERETNAASNKDVQLNAALKELKNEIRKLGKAQFKATAMVEDQSARWEQVVVETRASREQQAQLVRALAESFYPRNGDSGC